MEKDLKYAAVAMHAKALLLLLVAICGVSLYPGTASAALSRKAVVELVKKIQADYNSAAVGVYVNDKQGEDEPGLMVGDDISFTVNSVNERYLLLVLVDPKGVVNVVFPDHLVADVPNTYTRFAYPPPGVGRLTQGEPPGIETVLALASDIAITVNDFGFSSEYDIHPVGESEQEIKKFVQRLNTLFADARVDSFIYQYFVDSELQYGTRAVRRELKKRVEQVDILAKQEAAESGQGRTNSTASVAANSNVQSEALAVNDIRFETNSDLLTPLGRSQLDIFGDELVGVLSRNPALFIALEGHTDSSGAQEYNQALSERRAIAAKRYLVEQFGLSENNIVSSGSGETEPLVGNATAEARARNRRVEIRLGKRN